MAIAASNRSVLISQSEFGLGVARNGKRRRLKAVLLMAQVAFVGEPRRYELTGVLIGVTVRTDQFPQYVHRFAARRLMAASASDECVFTLQREGAVAVGFPVEQRGSSSTICRKVW